ncbi:hypothetical protein AB0N73_08840 [Microbacterium sp. NPDC089189]|uniref:hypothetical protein n=1 Tax=Microbacterium sp. NPDC089189 TaxID=3154972 RepID=UPI0034430ED2
MSDAVTGRGTREAFRTPDAWHSPATYWFWHHLPSDDQIRTQVREMFDAGFRSFQIQARLSFPQGAYLDDDYLRACRRAVDEAARLGMIVGIYDDYNWQSGHAAGRAVAGHDDLRERHLFWVRVPVDAGRGTGTVSGIRSATENLGPAAMAWHYEDAEVRWADWRIEHVLVGEGRDTVDVPGGARVDGDAHGCTVAVSNAGPAASALVLVSARCATSRLVNPLDRVAVERFVEAGYEPFRRAFGDHFGQTVRYVFFDQPHAVYYDWAERAGDPRSALPIHTAMTEVLRSRFGDELPAVWAAVLGETADAGALARRARFWETFSTYAIGTFLGTLADWSHRHGLLQTGHEVLGHVGSWTPGASFDTWDLRANFGLDHFSVDRYRDLTAVDAQDAVAQLSPRLGDGVARASGRHGTMVEQYFMTPPEGGTPWSGHWGLTLDELRGAAIRHHFAGMRQMVFHGFYQTHGHDRDHESLANPRFDFPPGVNVEPWFAGFHADYAAEAARLSEFLDGVGDDPEVLLLWPLRTFWTDGQTGPHADQVGAWARALTEADVPFRMIDERQLRTIADEAPTARALVLPSVRTLADLAAVQAVHALAARGVRVVASGRQPSLLQDGGVLGVAWDAVGSEYLVDVPSAGEVRAALGLDEDRSAVATAAGARVRSGLDADGARRAAVFNDGEGLLDVVLADGATEWDATEGSTRPFPAGRARLEPGELRLFVLSEAARFGVEVAAPPASAAMALTTGWTLRLPEGDERPIDVTAGWQLAHPRFSGTAVYRVTFEASGADDLVLRLPRVAGSARASVNNRALAPRGWRPFRFRIARGLLTPGANTLEVSVSGSAANAFYAGTGLRAHPEPNGLLAAPTLEVDAC